MTLEGVPATRCVIDDVTAPWDDATSCCGAPAPDGIPDVLCHFDRRPVSQAICAAHSPPPLPGDDIEVTLRALTIDGLPIEAADCARVTGFGCDEVALWPPTLPVRRGRGPLPSPRERR